MTASLPRRVHRALAIAFLLAATTARPGAAQVAGIAVGSRAPDVRVETLDGEPVSLAELARGKPMLLEFWATWCPLCKELQPAMEAAKEDYGDRVTFVGVGVPQNQSPERQRAFIEREGLEGFFVFDRNQEALGAYMVPHTSFVVVLDASGTVVYTGQGGEQDLDAAIARGLGEEGSVSHRPGADPGRRGVPDFRRVGRTGAER